MLNHVEIDILLTVLFLSVGSFLTLMAWKRSFPSVETISIFSALFNTPGGIIMFLWAAWWGTLIITLCFGVWVVRVGINPQHTVVTLVFGMLISQAFGTVNGALFKTMTGEKPPVPPNTKVVTEASNVTMPPAEEPKP